jgi:hypothetical protein
MTFITTQPQPVYAYHLARRRSWFKLFSEWANQEDIDHHIAWVGGTVTSMAAVFFPLTMTSILLNGAAFGLIIAAMTSLTLVVITNLAAMPVKYTIPIFCLAVITDMAIVVASFFIK